MSQRASPRIGEQAAHLESIPDSSLDSVLRLQCVLDPTLRPIHRSTLDGHDRLFAKGSLLSSRHHTK
jgi:hypothetical protein